VARTKLFSLQTITTIGVGILSATRVRNSKSKLQADDKTKTSVNKRISNKMERNIYITTVIMQLGFTISISKYKS